MNATTYGLDVAKRVFQMYWVELRRLVRVFPRVLDLRRSILRAHQATYADTLKMQARLPSMELRIRRSSELLARRMIRTQPWRQLPSWLGRWACCPSPSPSRQRGGAGQKRHSPRIPTS